MPDTTPTTDRQAAVRAIHALKSPPPPGSQHYQAGWDTGLEAAIEAVQGAFEADRARLVLGTTDQQPVTAPAGTELRDRLTRALDECRTMIPASQADVILSVLRQAGVLPAPTDRAAALRERADFLEGCLRDAADPGSDPRYWTAVRDVAMGLRRMADEAQQPETEAHEHNRVTALDGNDRPALDEHGHTWTHCGICGQKTTPAP